MLARLQAKASLKAKGWSNRKAAKELGVCWTHLSKVLNGHRKSRRLLGRISQLPPAPEKTQRRIK